MIDKGFRDMIGQYGVMKGVLYNNVAKYADALNGEAFIPTSKIKEMALAMRLAKTKVKYQCSKRQYKLGLMTMYMVKL